MKNLLQLFPLTKSGLPFGILFVLTLFFFIQLLLKTQSSMSNNTVLKLIPGPEINPHFSLALTASQKDHLRMALAGGIVEMEYLLDFSEEELSTKLQHFQQFRVHYDYIPEIDVSSLDINQTREGYQNRIDSLTSLLHQLKLKGDVSPIDSQTLGHISLTLQTAIGECKMVNSGPIAIAEQAMQQYFKMTRELCPIIPEELVDRYEAMGMGYLQERETVFNELLEQMMGRNSAA